MGVADLAFMPREIRVPLETMAFEWEHHYAPFQIEIANAGLTADEGADRPGVNLAFFVHNSNPLSCLTLTQADDIFAADHRRGGKNLRHWGELGLGGDWMDRPIHVYGPPLDRIAAAYLRGAVMAGSRKWNPQYHAVAGGWRALLEILAKDPAGIAYAPPLPGNEGVKALRLAVTRSATCYALDAQTAEARTYPLSRAIDIVLDRPPGASIDPEIREFLHYILSGEGQRTIASDGTYLPLSADSIRRQLQRLQ